MDIAEELRQALSSESIDVLGIPVTSSLLSAFIIVFAVGVICLVLRFVFLREYSATPRGVRLILEKAVGFFDNIAKGAVHSYTKYVGPVIFGVGLYIFCGTFIEVFGFKPIFADLNSGLAVGTVGFFVIQILGLKKKGVKGRLDAQFRSEKGIWGPVIGLIKTVSDCILPFSMALRLYGSILSGMLIVDLLYIIIQSFLTSAVSIAAWALPLSLVAGGVVGIGLTLFHAAIQAYVFATLVSLFTAESIE
ncbi:MAG: F0F1 ATP synthase subunit A [Clostridiales bacterium]|jgi:F-type H+-transporting ATPase subunit a|nr:F0F1 ATP synthase subunit A [Clostridiales bacterium]